MGMYSCVHVTLSFVCIACLVRICLQVSTFSQIDSQR
jgi:hypothetical protein